MGFRLKDLCVRKVAPAGTAGDGAGNGKRRGDNEEKCEETEHLVDEGVVGPEGRITLSELQTSGAVQPSYLYPHGRPRSILRQRRP